MTRREKGKPPSPGMKWSGKHGLWVDPDNRSEEQRAKDEAILQEAEDDRERIEAVLRTVREGEGPQSAAVKEAAIRQAELVLRSLIQAREKAGISQAEVARRMGVPQPAIVRLEAGTHSPTLSTLARYASAIGVHLEIRQPA
jgi:DNA-binding XRE family transcriptional regulator